MRISDWSSDVCSSDLYATYRPYRSFRPRSIDFINITHSPYQPLSVPAMFHHHGNEAHGPSQRLYGPWSQHQGHMHLTPLRPLSRHEGPHNVPLGRPQGLAEDAWLHGYASALYGLWAPQIGRASGRERVCQTVSISGGPRPLK